MNTQKAFTKLIVMPQELQVLRCYSCTVFQVHIVKKSRKWDCKICGKKQSIKKVYGRGNGHDCRVHVQELNKLAALQQETQIAAYGSYQNNSYSSEIEVQSLHGTAFSEIQHCMESNMSANSSSKWDIFLNKSENKEKEEEERKNNLPLCIDAPEQKHKNYRFSGNFHNGKNIIKSVGVGMDGAVCDMLSTVPDSSSWHNNEKHSLETATSSTLESSYPSSSIDPSLNEDYENVHLPKPVILPGSKWLKYINQSTINQPVVGNIHQVFNSCNKWELGISTSEERGNKFDDESFGHLKNVNKDKLMTQRDSTVQHFLEPNLAWEETKKQMCSGTEINRPGNASARNVNKYFNSFHAVDIDYTEDELNNILDL